MHERMGEASAIQIRYATHTLSIFTIRWAGTVAVDVTTSGCVALTEAAPPADSIIFIYLRFSVTVVVGFALLSDSV